MAATRLVLALVVPGLATTKTVRHAGEALPAPWVILAGFFWRRPGEAMPAGFQARR